MRLKFLHLRNRFLITIFASFILAVDLLFLYFFKYKNQGLPFSNFYIFFIGNLFNLAFTLLTILGLLIYTIKKESNYNSLYVIANTTVITLFLLFAFLSTKIKLPLPNIYLLDHPLNEIFKGLMFVLFQFMQFVFMMTLWMVSFGVKDLIMLRGVLNSIVLLFLLLAFSFVYINLKKEDNKRYNVSKNSINVAVVLGAAVWSYNEPSPSLAARVDKAVELYKKGIVNKIQLTGSNAPGELSEAEVAFDYIKFMDVNPKNVWLEKKTVSTSEQIEFIKEQIMTKKDVGNVIIVSDGYHLARVEEMCMFYNINAEVAPSDLKLSFQDELYYKIKESIALTVFWFFAL